MGRGFGWGIIMTLHIVIGKYCHSTNSQKYNVSHHLYYIAIGHYRAAILRPTDNILQTQVIVIEYL